LIRRLTTHKVLITFPQIIVLGFWEITRRDSAAEAVLAVSTILIFLCLLTWACYNVWHRARRSIALHKNPAYILFSDNSVLSKWGFLYVQFKASMYYFIIPILLLTLVKGLFIAFGQKSGDVQAIALVVLELIFLVLICVLRPYMDKKTNGFNIAIAAVNLFNVLLLLFFTGILGVPVSYSLLILFLISLYKNEFCVSSMNPC